MSATAAASRIGPSVTTAATPRTMSRVIRMSPNIPARCSPRLSQTSTWPGGQASMALRWGYSGSARTSGVLRSSRMGMVRSV